MIKSQIKQYLKQIIQNHLLIYFIFFFILLPKNKKGFEILKNLIDYRLQKKLERKYKNILNLLPADSVETIKPKIIWFCWLQGIENAPVLVRKCYSKIKSICLDYDVVTITANNFSEYTNISENIVSKWENGIITNTMFSDILRTNLLLNNGGTWIDSTVLLTDKIPEEIEKSEFFLFMSQKPGSIGHYVTISSWFLSSKKNHPFIKILNTFWESYWQKENRAYDYFLYHLFFDLILRKYPAITEKIPKFSNEPPHYLLYELENEFSLKKFEYIKRKSFAHKLSYKIKDYEEGKKTFYSYLVNQF